MKVKVECDQKDFNKINLGIHWRCLAAPWIFDIDVGFWDSWEKNWDPCFFQKSNPSTIFLTFWTNHLANFEKIVGKIEYDVPNKKPRRFGPISLKVKKL